MKSCFALMLLVALALTSLQHTSAQEPVLTFRSETIDSKVIIGYGVAIGDVDGDGKPDILLADKKQFVWYQNPTWNRHVLSENLTERDNVCIAARDIDGDGKVEIAVGGQWNPGDTINSGSVHYLIAPEDRTKMWSAIQLEHEPVVHRMRWVKTGEKQFALVVAPLHGRGSKGGEGAGARLMAYHKPEDPNQPWKTEVLDDQFHVTHNFDSVSVDASTEQEVIFYLGKEGAKTIQFDGQAWKSKLLNDIQGGGEIRFGRLETGTPFLTTIEPFHGTHLVAYLANKVGQLQFPERVVLDENFKQGHAIAVGDLFGNGSAQIVAGWRKPNKERKFGIKLYFQEDKTKKWNSMFVDENEMACEDLRIGDLDGDGRLDIVASGRSTHNLKIYWNVKSSKRSAK